VPAIARYSGQPYATPGVVEGLLDAMSRGLHIVVVSGGYGLVRAEEPIQDYEAPMERTLTVWRSRIPVILRDYVSRNAIGRTFGAFSQQYAMAVPDRLSEEDWRAVPNFAELGGSGGRLPLPGVSRRRRRCSSAGCRLMGSAVRVVPQRVADLTLGLLRHGLRPGDGWRRTP
jgi:hypothetical protein